MAALRNSFKPARTAAKHRSVHFLLPAHPHSNDVTEEQLALVQLDQVLVRGEELDRTPLAWLGERAAANSSKAILAELKKLDFLRELGVAEWDLSTINPNRLKFLAQLGRKATSQALQRMAHARRYPIVSCDLGIATSHFP
jgi:hypothetical protein